MTTKIEPGLGVVIGDLHLGLRVEEMDRTPEILVAVDTAIDTAIERGCAFVEFGGDIFDNNTPHHDHIAAFITRLNRLEEAGIETVVMGGNHEAVSAPGRFWALTPLEEIGYRHVHFVKKPCLMDADVLGFPALFLPHVTRATAVAAGFKSAQDYVESAAHELLEGVEAQVVAFSHYNLRAAKAGTEASMLRQSDLELPYWLTQDERVLAIFNHHIHTPQEFGKVYVPGSPVCTDFGDVDEDKGFLVVDVFSDHVTVERVRAPSSPLLEFELDFRELPAADMRKLARRALRHVTEDAIVKLRILIEEERLAEAGRDELERQFTARARALRGIQMIPVRGRQVRSAEQVPTLAPKEAVETFLRVRRPDGAERKLALALALMAGEVPAIPRAADALQAVRDPDDRLDDLLADEEEVSFDV